MIAYLQELANSLRNNKLRTFLTGFSITWGIIILVVMLGAGKGVENGIRTMVSAVGADQVKMGVYFNQTQTAYGGYQEGRQLFITRNQLDYLREVFSDRVSLMEPEFSFFSTGSTSFASQMLQIRTIGWPEQSFGKLELRAGRLFTHQEHNEQERVVLISDGLVSKLFASGVDPIGELFTVFGATYRIVGVVKSPSPFFGTAFVPLNTFEGIRPNDFVQIKSLAVFPKAGQAKESEKLAEDLARVAHQITRSDPSDTWSIYVSNSSDQAKTMDMIFLSLQVLLWVMGIGSLSIGTIGVSNIMHVTVQERMREIGIRKAIGAKPRDILRLVLGESLLLSMVAGVVGLFLGIGIVKLLDYLAVVNKWGQQEIPVGFSADDVMVLRLFENPEVNMGVAIGALIVLVVVGVVAGYGPAKKAIKIPAVVAMRDMK